MDAIIAVVNVVVCIYAFLRGAAYIKDPMNPNDSWWKFNAAMMAIASIGIILNFQILSRPFIQKGIPLPTSTVPDVQLETIEAELNKQARIAAERAAHITQGLALLKGSA
jgi:hypothetical protein